MNILVTGGAGFIGSIITRKMLEEGHQVTVVDDLRTGNKDAIPDGAKLFVGDFANTDIFRHAIKDKIDVVIHTAASMSPTISLREPMEYFTNNLKKSIELLNWAVNSGVHKFIFSSSACTYGIPAKSPVAEEDAYYGVTPYGDTKLNFECIMEWYNRAYNISCVAFRYFNVAGAVGDIGPDKPFNSGVIPIMLKSILTGKLVQLFGTDYNTPDGTCVRDYIHVGDIADAYPLVLGNVQGSFNLGSGKGHSLKELAAVIREVTGKDVLVEYAGRRLGDPDSLIADVAKSTTVLAWKPEKSGIENIIRDTWEWMSHREEVK